MLIKRNILRSPLQFALIVVITTVSFLLFGLLVSLRFSVLGDSVAAGDDRLVVFNRTSLIQPLPYGYVDRIRQLTGVRDLTYSTWFGGYFKTHTNFLPSFAIDPSSYLRVYPELQLGAAERAAFLEQRDGLLVSRATADRFGWKMGDRVNLASDIFVNPTSADNSWDFVVCCVFTNSAGGGDDHSVYFRYDYFNEVRQLGKDTVGSIVVVPSDRQSSEVLPDRIDRLFENSQDETRTVPEKQFTKEFVLQFGNVELVVRLVVGAAFCSMLLVIGNALMMSIRNRAKEIATLKAIGFPEHRIARLVLCEAALTTLIGTIIGLVLARAVLGVVSTNPIFSALHMNAVVWGLGLAIGAVLGAAAAAGPVLRALKVTVARTLTSV